MVFKWPLRPIFSFFTIQYIEIKHLFSKNFGRCANILTFNSECNSLLQMSNWLPKKLSGNMVFKWPLRPIFSFFTIQYIEIKHLFSKNFGRCANILTFNSECNSLLQMSNWLPKKLSGNMIAVSSGWAQFQPILQSAQELLLKVI